MPVEKELAQISPEKDMLLTIGVFDGVHLGHKYLISKLLEHARQQDLLSGVVTFHPHPQAVLSPQTKLSYLTDPDTKAGLLKNEGVGVVITLSFTLELAELSAREFVGLLKKYLRMRGLVIGPDFALGRNREGNADTLRTLGQEMDFSVIVVPPLMVGSEIASSTAIRKAIASGDVKKAAALLGHPFSLHGRVISGIGRGVGLGFPTANLDINSRQALPADGVYATWAYVDDKAYQSMTNIGMRPTFRGSERSVEVHLLDYQGSLYGREVRISLIERLRDEKRFATIDALKKQIAADVKQGKAILGAQGGN